MKIKYVGLFNSVQIAATRQMAEKGKPVDVDSKVAKELLKQSVWEKVTTKENDDG